MGIMNRNLKRYTLKEEGFPEKLNLTMDELQKSFYFGGCFYMNNDADEIFISYKAMPWDNKKLDKE